MRTRRGLTVKKKKKRRRKREGGKRNSRAARRHRSSYDCAFRGASTAVIMGADAEIRSARDALSAYARIREMREKSRMLNARDLCYLAKGFSRQRRQATSASEKSHSRFDSSAFRRFVPPAGIASAEWPGMQLIRLIVRERERAKHIHKCWNVRALWLALNDEIFAVRTYIWDVCINIFFYLRLCAIARPQSNLRCDRPTQRVLCDAHHLSPYLSLRHPLSR